jgi:hypothetical protein
MDQLIGQWKATGKSFGMPAETTMVWERTLSGKFNRITYRIVMHPASGPDQLFEGEALYKASKENEWAATWFDSQGSMHPITATHENGILTSLWGTPATRQGKTLYRIVDKNTLELTDLILNKDGTWKEFNKQTLSKN